MRMVAVKENDAVNNRENAFLGRSYGCVMAQIFAIEDGGHERGLIVNLEGHPVHSTIDGEAVDFASARDLRRDLGEALAYAEKAKGEVGEVFFGNAVVHRASSLRSRGSIGIALKITPGKILSANDGDWLTLKGARELHEALGSAIEYLKGIDVK